MRRPMSRIRIGDEIWIVRKAIALAGKPEGPTACACPACKQSAQKKTPKGDVTQYGFAWDQHRVFFECRCGCIFYHDYRIWHDDTESR